MDGKLNSDFMRVFVMIGCVINIVIGVLSCLTIIGIPIGAIFIYVGYKAWKKYV